jgi:hypothetical protein
MLHFFVFATVLLQFTGFGPESKEEWCQIALHHPKSANDHLNGFRTIQLSIGKTDYLPTTAFGACHLLIQVRDE